MSAVSLLEITASSSGSERVSVSAEASSAVGKLPQKPLNLITISGQARTGKSFFMNTLAGAADNDVFAVGGGSHPCTVGSFISTTTRSLSDFGSELGSPPLSSSMSGMNLGDSVQPEIGFVDVEGKGDKDINYELKLATPLLLLSKVVIYNWRGLPAKATILDSLGTMRAAAATIEWSQRQGAFGHLIVLLRDVAEKEEEEANSIVFGREDGRCTTLEAQEQRDLRNSIREDLKESFQSVRVCCLPPPHEHINDRQISQGEVSLEFAAKIKKLRHLLATDLLAKPHSFGNEDVVGGELLSSLLTGVCEAVNGGLSDFVPLSLMQSIQQGRAETVLLESKNLFNERVAKSVEDKPPLSKAATDKVIEAATSTAVGHFTGQTLAASIVSKYRQKLGEVIEEGSKACYAAQERQVLKAINQVKNLRSESLQQVDKEAIKIFSSLPMAVDGLKRRWEGLCADVYGQLQRSVVELFGSGILEDLQGEMNTQQQFEDSVSDKLSNLVALNQSLMASKAETETLKKGLRATKEAVEEAKKQAEAAQRGNEQLLQKMRENEERAQRAQQAQMEREARSQLMQDAVSLAAAAISASRYSTAEASGSSGAASPLGARTPSRPSDAATGSDSVRTATAARDVDVGPIWNQAHAERRASEYVAEHPDQEWNGHWTSARGTSFIGVRGRPTRDVDVGPIRNQAHAERRAREYLAEHPDQEWNGQWTSARGTSFIGVRDKA